MNMLAYFTGEKKRFCMVDPPVRREPDGVELGERLEERHHVRMIPMCRLRLMTKKKMRAIS